MRNICWHYLKEQVILANDCSISLMVKHVFLKHLTVGSIPTLGTEKLEKGVVRFHRKESEAL